MSALNWGWRTVVGGVLLGFTCGMLGPQPQAAIATVALVSAVLLIVKGEKP